MYDWLPEDPEDDIERLSRTMDDESTIGNEVSYLIDLTTTTIWSKVRKVRRAIRDARTSCRNFMIWAHAPRKFKKPQHVEMDTDLTEIDWD